MDVFFINFKCGFKLIVLELELLFLEVNIEFNLRNFLCSSLRLYLDFSCNLYDALISNKLWMMKCRSWLYVVPDQVHFISGLQLYIVWERKQRSRSTQGCLSCRDNDAGVTVATLMHGAG
jgi:hypothetical protein